MLGQLLQETSFFACLPDSQNARWRWPAWHVMQIAVRSSAPEVLNLLTIRFFVGSCRCALASPWHAWHMLPDASFFAPCGVSAIDAATFSWQFAQIGVSA